MRLRARKVASAVRCPYCHGDLEGEVLTCDDCGAATHRECADDLRGGTCPTLGCGARLRPSILDQPPVTFEAPQPPAWFWPTAVVTSVLVGGAACWTSGAYPRVELAPLLRPLGMLSIAFGVLGIQHWLGQRGLISVGVSRPRFLR